MDSKLVEEIEEVLEKYPTPDECLPMETGDCFDLVCLLQRCLESLRWKYAPEEPTETGDYLVETEDQYGDVSFEIMRYKVSKAFGNKWELLGFGYTLVRWPPIPQ